MELHFRHTIDVSLGEAWHIFHTHIDRMGPDLPDVEQIRILDQREQMDLLEQQVVWAIHHSVVPASARPFIAGLLDELLSTLTWDHGQREVAFRFYNDELPDLFDCRGRARLNEARNGTDIEITAELDIQPHQLPGVPRWLGQKIQPSVRRVVEQTLGRILDALPAAVARMSHDAGAEQRTG